MAVRFDPERQSWMFVIDLPAGPDGRRRQMFRRGFQTETPARSEERLAKQQFGRTDLAADGTVAAELTQWLGERERDVGNHARQLSKRDHEVRDPFPRRAGRGLGHRVR
jgi:Arm DNA-binding domain